MVRVLITGMSGAGKSTLLGELARRGRMTVDTDYGDWKDADGCWHEPRMVALLDEVGEVVVSGAADNQGRFYDRFEHVVLLSAPVETLIVRVSARTNNPYGRTPEQQREIRDNVRQFEPLMRRSADLELDGTRPVAELADVIEDLLVPPEVTQDQARRLES